MTKAISIVIPAKNEGVGLTNILPKLVSLHPDAEIIVVNDGSSDDTEQVAKSLGAKVVSHPYSKGNGASIKTGMRAASADVIVCMDADGQHQPKDIQVLLDGIADGYDMVVGARKRNGQASIFRGVANGFYNRFSSWVVGHKILDLTSGFRAVKRQKMLEFISLLPNKFSYPTTITMSFFRAGYSVAYRYVEVLSREEGTTSHISLGKDGIRFLLIIFKVGTLFSPLKIFMPISLGFFVSALAYYLFTYFSDGRFTNMGLLLFTTSILIFLMGLLSEQITTLIYKGK